MMRYSFPLDFRPLISNCRGEAPARECRWTLSILLLLLFFSVPSEAFDKKAYDLVIAGAGAGGSAAAIQAGRSGLSVALLEESDFIGGQITGAAVSTMDDLGGTRTGIYGEFTEKIKEHYASLGVASNICLWGGDTISTEPSVARMILTDMLTSAGVDIFPLTSVERAIMDGGRITGVEAVQILKGNAKKFFFESGIFIDATEHGDLIPLTGASYRIGSSISPAVDPEANVQDITYAAVVKKYARGLPDELRMPGPPPGYERHAERFRGVVALSGDRWPGSYPFDVPTHNAYRALPDPDNRMPIAGDDPDTWEFITKTCINWANDFPGERGDRPGLSVLYIEDREQRRKIEREAMNKTLAFIWYMQSELGMEDWSADDGQGYGGYFSNDWETADDPLLPPEFAKILRHFPPFPYVREGRRIVGMETLVQSDISRDVSRGRAYKNYPSGLALGEYPVDVHGSHLDRYMERALGESSESFPKTWAGRQGVFQVPFGVFIPERIDGLIAAEKNISVSRMVNGAIRLQPIAMHTGQAAGAIASEAEKSGLLPRDVNIFSVQRALIESGAWIALDRYADVSKGDPYWLGVQWASLYEALSGVSKNHFGVTLPMRGRELSSVMRKALDGSNIEPPSFADGEYVSNREFYGTLADVSDERVFLPPHMDPELSVTRGDALNAALELFQRAESRR
jgi:hypothetical protein